MINELPDVQKQTDKLLLTLFTHRGERTHNEKSGLFLQKDFSWEPDAHLYTTGLSWLSSLGEGMDSARSLSSRPGGRDDGDFQGGVQAPAPQETTARL